MDQDLIVYGIGALTLAYIFYKLARMFWGKKKDEDCASGSCSNCHMNNRKGSCH